MARLFGCFALAIGLGLAMPARADDWPQFRRDSGRTAASADKIQFPLSELWTWSTRGPKEHTPLYHAVVWQDSVYFTASDKNQRYLICAEARTGNIRWRRALATEQLKFVISDIAGPAVSSSGTVFIYDWVGQRTVHGRAAGGDNQGAQSSGEVEKLNSFTVRTFAAENGAEEGYFPLAAMGANGVLPRLSLLEGPQGQTVNPVPPTFVGCPP